MDEANSKNAAYRRCKLKKFPQLFTFKGNTYVIESKHEKYLKMPINALFVSVDDHLVPLPVDSYANVVKIKDKKKQQMFSKTILNMSPREKDNRTLALSTREA
ncbi:MAG: hypothetical protein JXB88_04295 [Spirochaetales bacterium]|nr:hypothetical protein [Spirochaetales bacterium]